MRSMTQDSFTFVKGSEHEFGEMKTLLVNLLRKTVPINRGRWQSEDVSESDAHAAHELANVCLMVRIPSAITQLQTTYRPDLPWAENHFQERVSGSPLNPAPSYVDWPYHSAAQQDRHVRDGVFSHTYPERMWPKTANSDEMMTFASGRSAEINVGIRYAYGDLYDLVCLLKKDPFTRQAYLPIWFPEDTGAAFGQRVPCTLGYHFIRRGMLMDCNYFIRSCDVYRHLTNDAYMAARLCQWIVASVGDPMVWPGNLNVHISNLHLFRGDSWRIDRQGTTC